MLKFLDLPDDGRSIFPKINARKVHRFPMLGSLLLRPPTPARAMWKKLRSLTGPSISLPIEYLIHMNAKTNLDSYVSPGITQVMKACFEPDILKLSKLIERDLTHWVLKI